MANARQKLGQRGEQLAVDKLRADGFEIVTRNYHCRTGELDIVARQADIWVFVEVRTRKSQLFGTPEESITDRKRQHLITAAQTYLQEQALQDVNWRIDLVAIEIGPKGELVRLEVLENAINDL
jgi:putative endonuclease